MKTITIIIRNSKSFLYLSSLLAAALVSGQVAAATPTLVLDGCTIPIKSEAKLDLGTGNIVAFTDGPNDCIEAPEAGSPVINSFTLNAGTVAISVAQGDSFTVSWNSSNTTGCSASGSTFPGWGGSKATSSTQPLSTAGVDIATGYRLRLTCSNSETGESTASQDRFVNVVAPDDTGTLSCATRQPPPGMTRETNMDFERPSVTTRFWTDLWGTAFPIGDVAKIRLQRGTYSALEFNSGTEKSSGTIRLAPPGPGSFGSSVSNGLAVVSISACPGDFGSQLDPACRKLMRPDDTLRWQRGASSSFKCGIKDNQVLFLNITYSSDLSIPEWSCSGSKTKPCGSLMSGQ